MQDTPTLAGPPGASDAPCAGLVQPATPKRAPNKRPRVVTPASPTLHAADSGDEFPAISAIPMGGLMPFRPKRAPVAPAPAQPESEAGREIQATYAEKAKKDEEAGRTLARIGDYLTREVGGLERAGLKAASELVRALNKTVRAFCKDIANGGDGTAGLTAGPPAPAPTPAPAPGPASRLSTARTPSPASSQSTGGVAFSTTNSSKTYASALASGTESPPLRRSPPPANRLFARLAPDHPARAASPYATLEKLKRDLPANVSAEIKSIQAVPTGLAITPKVGAVLLPGAGGLISAALDGAEVAKEQKWAMYVVPRAPRSYADYEGARKPISEQRALEEFKEQTGMIPLKFYWAKGAGAETETRTETGTIIIAFPVELADKVPRKVSLFGVALPVIRKLTKPRVQQCGNCWDFHDPRVCTRKPRCRRCGSTDHVEGEHAHVGPKAPLCDCPDRCTNCRGPHPANDLGCPIRPVMEGGVIQRKTRSQKEAIRRAQSIAYHVKHESRRCKAAAAEAALAAALDAQIAAEAPATEEEEAEAEEYARSAAARMDYDSEGEGEEMETETAAAPGTEEEL